MAIEDGHRIENLGYVLVMVRMRNEQPYRSHWDKDNGEIRLDGKGDGYCRRYIYIYIYIYV